jgi:predicted nucleic acid-binding Zn ribbon protein
MSTVKASPLTVSLYLPDPQVVRREAKLYADKSGYLFIKYTGEKVIEEFDTNAITELLKIVPTIESILDYKGKRRKGIYNLPDIDSERVLNFINRYGVLGISDIPYRNEVLLHLSLTDITRLTWLPLKQAQGLFKDGHLDPEFRARILAIRNGEEVPFKRVLDILKDLAKSVRLYMNLLEDDDFANGREWELNTKNRKRIVSAWSFAGGVFTDQDDPADPKFNSREEWTYRYGKNKEYSTLDLADEYLSKFASVQNKNIELISKSVISTHGMVLFNLENAGLETAISTWILNTFSKVKVRRFCKVCGYAFVPQRIKTENKYCTERCAKSVRQKKYRQKQKKVSAEKAGSKKSTNRKEKKNEPTQNRRTKGRDR